MDRPTFVVTAKLDEETSLRLNALRKRYFPPHRNFIDAHLTLVHKISLEGLTILREAVASASPQPFEILLSEPYALGRGLAIRIESNLLVSLRNRLAKCLHAELSAQDRQPFKPHVTIQNKVTPEEAKESLNEVRREWFAVDAEVGGIDLWEYLDGPWEHWERLSFDAGSIQSPLNS